MVQAGTTTSEYAPGRFVAGDNTCLGGEQQGGDVVRGMIVEIGYCPARVLTWPRVDSWTCRKRVYLQAA